MSHPFQELETELTVNGKTYKYYSLQKLAEKDARVNKLPLSVRVLLEAAIRKADNFVVTKEDVETILNWEKTSKASVEIPFKPSRVILQDFTGVPAVVDLAAMRDSIVSLGGKAAQINPLVPVDLVIDHSVQVDYHGDAKAVDNNLDKEMERNMKRFQFLKWGASAFNNFKIVPPGSGIVHQVNLEYLGRVVFEQDGVLYPDSVVGTDSHTTMINGLGVVGWGVGGIEAEAVMLGQHISMVLPEVVGFHLKGKLPSGATATDLVLTITSMLRKKGVVEKFVEYYGEGLGSLSLADRATIANMAPEYGSTIGFFPVDSRTMDYLKQTNRPQEQRDYIEAYMKAQGMFVDGKSEAPVFSDTIELDLSTVVPCLAGPKRPHDKVNLKDMKQDFITNLQEKVTAARGYGINDGKLLDAKVPFEFNGGKYALTHGDVVIAAITSCTNTSNPSVLIAAGLVAKNAVEMKLAVKPYIKCSLAPGSHVATKYLESAGLQGFLDKLGFFTVGYGCTTCIGNSGDIPKEVEDAITNKDTPIVATAVLSGNRNFEGRVHPNTRANYLASPPLVVAYALAGTVNIDFEKEPIGVNSDGKEVFLKDIWPSSEEVAKVENENVKASMFEEVYKNITDGTKAWQNLKLESKSETYPWDKESDYIHQPPFFLSMKKQPDALGAIDKAHVLLNLGDSITTDHISPAGKIGENSPAGKFLKSKGIQKADFNTYGARRGHDEIMARGTFANPQIRNKLMAKDGQAPPPSAKTLFFATENGQPEVMDTYDAAKSYMDKGIPTVIFGGNLYGSGSSRDWAAKGPFLQGVKCVIAQSFERIHRSNLIGMGILPVVFKAGESADAIGLTGKERLSIDRSALKVGQDMVVTVEGNDKVKEFTVKSRVDTEVELEYMKNGGILQYVIRQMLSKAEAK